MLGAFAIAGAVGIGALIALGQLARRRLRHRYQPCGRLVDIGGYRLHLDERGTEHSGPTVVLEGGAMAPGLAWEPVQRRVAAFARVVSYDRAGLGWSDPSRRPRTAPEMADELRALLDAGEVPGPYVLVGHSLGGTIVRVFAAAYPERVAGLVLLDASHEDQFTRAPRELRDFMAGMSRRMPALLGLLRLLVRGGIVALRPSLVPAAMGPLPAETLDAIRARVAATPSVIAAMADEMRSLEASNDAVRGLAIRSLGPIPLTVISHGRPEGVPPQFGPEVAAAYESLWQELQVAQSTLSPLGRRAVADGVGHNVPTEAPELVADAIRAMLDEARRPGVLAS